MKRRTPQWRAARKQAGVSLITAVFLLVVFAGLGAAMLNVFTSQHASSAMDVLGVRAYQAARAGIEWGVFRQTRNNSCLPTQSFALPANSTLSVFTVTVTCARTADAGVGATPAAAVAGTITVDSALVTGVDVTGNGLVAGMRVWGAGIVPGTIVLAANGLASTLTLSIAATAAATTPLTFISALDRWDITATACNQPTAGGTCPNQNASPDYVQRRMQVQF